MFSKENQDKINITRLKGHQLLASLGQATIALPDEFKFHCYNLVRQAVSHKSYTLMQDSIICPVQDDSSILAKVDGDNILFSVVWENAFIGNFSLQDIMQETRFGSFIVETWDTKDQNSLFAQLSDIINKRTAEDMVRFYKAFGFQS